MKVILRHTKTEHYYMGNSSWSTERIDAKAFKNLEDALQLIIRDRLGGMSLVVLHDGSTNEQVFDLASEDPLPQTK